MKIRVATQVRGSLNPYPELVHTRHAPLGVRVWEMHEPGPLRVDIVHVHWPEHLLGESLSARNRARRSKWLAWLRLQRALGAKVIWTAHNVVPHRWDARPEQWASVLATFGALVDGAVLLTEASRAEVRSVAPWIDGVPSMVIPHPHYRDVLGEVPDGRPRPIERILIVGRAERHKGLDTAIDAVGAIDGLHLTIAGQSPEPDYARHLASRASASVELLLNAPSHAAVARLAAKHDALLVPQEQFLNSGAVLLGLSLNLPTLAARTPSTCETQDVVGRDWLRLFDGPLDSATLGRVLRDGPGGRPDLSRFEPALVTAAHIAFYERVLKADS